MKSFEVSEDPTLRSETAVPADNSSADPLMRNQEAVAGAFPTKEWFDVGSRTLCRDVLNDFYRKSPQSSAPKKDSLEPIRGKKDRNPRRGKRHLALQGLEGREFMDGAGLAAEVGQMDPGQETVEVITPSFSFSASPDNTLIVMEYKNVERDNLRLDLIQVWERRPNCRIAVADIPSGSGTVTISPPNDPDRAAELVISLRSTGEHKSPYITLTTSSYKVTSAPSGSFELPEFSVTRVIAAPPAPVETPVAAAPVPIEEPIASEQGLRLDLMDVSATPSESALWNNAMALQQRWNTFNASGNYADGQVPGAKWVESQVTKQRLFITSEGNVYLHHGAGMSTAEFLCRVHLAIVDDPALLWSGALDVRRDVALEREKAAIDAALQGDDEIQEVPVAPTESALWNNAMALQQRWNTFNASGNYADGQVPGAKWVESQVTKQRLFITSEGNVYLHHGAGMSTAEFLCRVHLAIVDDPALLWSGALDVRRDVALEREKAAIDAAMQEDGDEIDSGLSDEGNEEIDALVAELTAIQTALAAEAEAPPAKEMLTPRFFFSASPDNRSIVLTYENVGNDALRLDLLQIGERRPNCLIGVADIPAGSGTVMISPPNDSNRAAELVISLRATGEHVSPYIELTTSDYTVITPPRGSFELPAFAYEAPIADSSSLETAPAAPSYYLELMGNYGFVFHYENMTSDSLSVAVVPQGSDPAGTAYMRQSIPQGSGAVSHMLSLENSERKADIVFYDVLTGEVFDRRGFMFYEGKFTQMPAAELAGRYPDSIRVLDVTLSGLQDHLARQIHADVSTRLSPLPDARTLAARKFPGHLTMTEDLSPQAGQFVGEANAAIHTVYAMDQARAAEAFRLLLREHAYGERATAAAVQAAINQVRETDRANAGFYGIADTHAASEILEIVRSRFVEYYRIYAGVAQTEQDANRQEFVTALAASDPDPDGHVSDPLAVLEANRESLIYAWNEQGYDGEALFAARMAGMSQEEAIAYVQNPVVAGETFVGPLPLEAEGATLTTDLGVIYERTTPENILLTPAGRRQLTFTLEQASMVNFWVEPGNVGEIQNSLLGLPNLLLNLRGTTVNYTSNKPYSTAGESISAPLPAGIYTLTIQDMTDYTGVHPDELQSMHIPQVPVGMNIKRYNTANIQGQISIPERDVTMPVSMRMAAFDSDINKRIDIDPATGLPLKLDPTKPVWVVIPGRGDSDVSDPMSELSKNLWLHNVQVMTVNWHDAASDNRTAIGLQGSEWIETVGAWASNQLSAAGFVGEKLQNVFLVGHSWGTYVSYEVAERMGDKIGGIVALDPAKDNALLGGKYDPSQVNFSRFAMTSYALHSSAFGDRSQALTASHSFEIRAPEGYEGSMLDVASLRLFFQQRYAAALGSELADELFDAWREHGFAVTLFSSLLKDAGSDKGGISALFSPLQLGMGLSTIQVNPEGFEGSFFVDPFKSVYTQGEDAGKTWWKAGGYSFDAHEG